MTRWLLPLFLVLSACSSASSPTSAPTLEQRLDRLATCHPTDLMVLAPWIGPGFDETTGALLEPLPAGHIEVVAQGWRRRDAEATKLRTEQGAIVLQDALERPGLIGFESVESDVCDISISHTLWKDQASMMAFVTGPKHANAMANAPKMHYAFAGAHWSGAMRTTPPTWEEGIQRFIAEKRAALK